MKAPDLGKKLRQALVRTVREKLETGRRVILPVPLYGRGLELLYLLKTELPHAVIRVDETFTKCADETLGDAAADLPERGSCSGYRTGERGRRHAETSERGEC